MSTSNGRATLSRALVYELGEYEDGRTLRGFIRPVNRITRQLQREGLVGADVAPALEPVYEQGVQAAYFSVPPDVRKLLRQQRGCPTPTAAGRRRTPSRGPMTS